MVELMRIVELERLIIELEKQLEVAIEMRNNLVCMGMIDGQR